VTDRESATRLFAQLRPSAVVNCVRDRSTERKLGARSWTGLQALRRLLSHSRANGARLVHVGSAAEYGRAFLRKRSVTERSQPLPLTPYGKRKLMESRLAMKCFRDGDDVVVARIFNLIGPGEGIDTVGGAWVKRLKQYEQRGELHTVRVRRTIRDFIDVRDAGRALCLLASHPRAQGLYNVSTGRGTRIDALVRRIAQLTRAPVRVFADPPGPVDRDGPAAAIGSARRLHSLGWRPWISLRESLEALISERGNEF